MKWSLIALVVVVDLLITNVHSKPARSLSRRVRSAEGGYNKDLLEYIEKCGKSKFYEQQRSRTIDTTIGIFQVQKTPSGYDMLTGVWVYHIDSSCKPTSRDIYLSSLWVYISFFGSLILCSCLCVALGVVGFVKTRCCKRRPGKSKDPTEEQQSTEDGGKTESE